MAKTYHKIIYFLIIIFLISCESEPTRNVVGLPGSTTYTLQRDTVIPSYIYDGDTFEFSKDGHGKLEVRILDVDTYETFVGTRLQEQADRNGISLDKALELGNEAKNWARNNILGREIVIYRDGNRNTDTYDRLLRKVIIDGQSYDSIMKANGWHTGLN